MTLLAVTLLLAGVQAPTPAQEVSPAARQALFLKSLQEGKAQEAFAELFRGSPILERKDEVANLIQQTMKGVEIYGGVTGQENLGLTRQQKHVAFGAAIVACNKAPLYYYFVWYRPREDAAWILHNMWFDDKSREFLGLQGPASK